MALGVSLLAAVPSWTIGLRLLGTFSIGTFFGLTVSTVSTIIPTIFQSTQIYDTLPFTPYDRARIFVRQFDLSAVRWPPFALLASASFALAALTALNHAPGSRAWETPAALSMAILTMFPYTFKFIFPPKDRIKAQVRKAYEKSREDARVVQDAPGIDRDVKMWTSLHWARVVLSGVVFVVALLDVVSLSQRQAKFRS